MARTKEEMFQSYKKDIMARARNNSDGEMFFDGTIPPKTGWTRFCTIQYTCSFPKIDPIRMTAELIKEGIKVYFDNTSITEKENMKLEKKVSMYLKGLAE